MVSTTSDGNQAAPEILGSPDCEIFNRFSYHPPNVRQVEIYDDVRRHFMILAHYLNKACPDSREKSVMFTELETALMWANASIARNWK